VVADVGNPNVVPTVDSYAMGFADQFVPPRVKELSIVIEAENWLLAPMEQKEPALAVEIDGGNWTE
jgi:hypothetical protein